MSLENFYGKFCGICQEIDLSKPITADVVAMKQQRESMPVSCFLSAWLSLFDGARSQILGAMKLPSLSKVFSRLHQVTLLSVATSPTNHSALAASVGPYCPLGNTYGRGGQ